MSKIINVYINGTTEPNGLEGHWVTLPNVLHELTIDQSSYCLPGHAVNNSDRRDCGGIFTFNLETQLDFLVTQIKERLKNKTAKIILNIMGFGRGGAGAFWVCEKLKEFSPHDLEINICALDPVPGNFVRVSYLDNISGFKTTLSGQIADLSACININKMLILFTNEPMQDIGFCAPILPIAPSQAKMIVDVIPGCHNNVQRYTLENNTLKSHTNYSIIAMYYVTNFLKTCGTKFNFAKFEYEGLLNPTANIIPLLEFENTRIERKTRWMHFYNQINSKENKPYLNLLHKLSQINTSLDNLKGCALTIKDPNPTPSYWYGQKSNGYFPTFAKMAGTAYLAANLYERSFLQAVLALTAYGMYSYKPNIDDKKYKL